MENLVVFITGSSSGIGRASALLYAARGSRLVLTYHQHEDEGKRTREECLRLGAREVLLIPLDLADDRSITAAAEKVTAHFHAIDILINNAGTIVKGQLEEYSFEEIDRQFAINLIGTVKLTRACLPSLRRSIITVGSTLALRGRRRLSIYSASKSGLRGFMQALAQERPDLIILTVHPSLTATRMGSPAGVDPLRVAEVVVRASEGGYRLKPGSDIALRDYRFGPVWGKIRSITRAMRDSIVDNI